ncbi:MAG TPA: hypothetical protein VEF06_14525 [Bryobacteraceae bacterium]|nr:hypothetical protein [Bryobacteraceae bacterium]
MPSDMAAVSLPRPAERVAIISLCLVFLCGMVVGAVAMSVTGHAGLHATAHGTTPPVGHLSMSVTEWKEKLELTDEQTVQLTSILDDFSRYYDNVLADGNTRIMQILNPEQKRRFERMLREHKP